MFGMFGFAPSPIKMAAKVATTVGNAVLPERLANMINELAEMSAETEALRDKLLNPIQGPLLPFCTKNYSFDIDRIMFCSQVTKDIIAISAGGTGIATLAMTLLDSPDQVFGFFTEAFIPVLDELKAEGKDFYKSNIDRALMRLMNVNTDIMKSMSLDQFLALVMDGGVQQQITAQTPATESTVTRTNCSCTCPAQAQVGGRVDMIYQLSYRELQKCAKELGISAKGSKEQLRARISHKLI